MVAQSALALRVRPEGSEGYGPKVRHFLELGCSQELLAGEPRDATALVLSICCCSQPSHRRPSCHLRRDAKRLLQRLLAPYHTFRPVPLWQS